MDETTTILSALQAFAAAVTAKSTTVTSGEPEEQLRGPFENFIKGVGAARREQIVCTGEARLPDRLGQPDFAIHRNDVLTGYVELKAPGIGADARRFKGRNREQFKRFSNIPNLLYSDGNEWALYRDGAVVGSIVRLSGDVATEGREAVAPDDARAVEKIVRDFLEWEPFLPLDRRGKLDLRRFAVLLAPLCRMLRDDVADALTDQNSRLANLAADWRKWFFPDATDREFADGYAQTVTFALLLARSEGADPLTLESAPAALAAEHSLLARALPVLTDARAEDAASLGLLLRVIAVVPPTTFVGPEDPWLYFYEDFLAIYDPELRKKAGAYYTPIEVVRCQVRLIDDLLVHRLGKRHGFADPEVVTLDPAAGTGTYLLGVIEHALARVAADQGTGAVPGHATTLARNLCGFERMVGPYAVAELRVSRALRDRGASLPKDGIRVYLTDTLESPHAETPYTPLYLKPLADQHAKALEVKREVPVIVCLGNPPYDRHAAVTVRLSSPESEPGAWVRFGDKEKEAPVSPKTEHAPETKETRQSKKQKKLPPSPVKLAALALKRRERSSILYRDFVAPAIAAGHGIHVKNLYNFYVYFWRWALWKVFEHETTRGLGVVSFISASSYLDGDAFCGLREHMRRLCDEIWILDLGGEGRGTRQSENVFAIQTPVAIAVAVRRQRAKKNKPARVHYMRLEGTRREKLATLDTISTFRRVKWQECSNGWHAPFRPAGKGDYFACPLLTDLIPWQHTGCEFKRTWPICSDQGTLKERWFALLKSNRQTEYFRETRDRKVSSPCSAAPPNGHADSPLARLPQDTPAPRIVRYAYRSFDRQWVLADNRLGDYLRPDLWRAHGPEQLYLASSVVLELGDGPAITSSSHIPDRHYFAGRGGKDIFPLYRSADAKEANILPGLLDLLGKAYKRQMTPEDFLAYVYGVLAQPAFTARYEKELGTRELRVPITKDAALFERVRDVGVRLLWLHTYGERFVPKGKTQGQVPTGAVKCVKAVPESPDGYPERFEYIDGTCILRVGAGEFAPVTRAVFEFEVSGLKVVQSWLKYRMKNGAGKKSSPLDYIRPERWTGEFTTELLELLRVLEATVAGYPEQAQLLDAVVAGDCLQADELPPVPSDLRKPPVLRTAGKDMYADLEDP